MWNVKRRKPAVASELEAAEVEGRALQDDLKALGVEDSLAAMLAKRLVAEAALLEDDAYDTFLQAVAVTHRTHVEATSESEVKRLVDDFAVELQKLDEGLKLLSAYLLRLRDRSESRPRRSVVH